MQATVPEGSFKRDGHEETLRQNPRHAPRLLGDAHQTSVPLARDSLANEGLVVRKPNSGSARQRWARENSKHRRTATRQRGFCGSYSKQSPFDCCQSRVTLENSLLKIVGEAYPLRAPAQSTELPKFRGCGGFCQFRSGDPAERLRRLHADLPRHDDQHRVLRYSRQWIDFVATIDA